MEQLCHFPSASVGLFARLRERLQSADWRFEKGRISRRLKRALYLLRYNSLATVMRFELLEILKRKQTMRLNVDGVDLLIRTCSPDLVTACACLYDPGLEEVRSRLSLPRFGFIIDAGGYIGAAAIALARMFPSATVVSIEPSSENFKLLEENVKPFRNVIAVNKALLDSPRSTELRNRGTGEWGYTVVERPLDCRNAAALQCVNGTTIESLLQEHSKEGIDVLKLDIEGAEKDVLDNSGAWIGCTAILVAELHERIVRGCTASFYSATAGFEYDCIDGGKLIALNRRLM
jgi:FkbM family methyltransferase